MMLTCVFLASKVEECRVDCSEIVRRAGKPEWEKDADLLDMTKILFWGQGSTRPKCLSIGAPTSPIVSNIIMYDLDTLFVEEATRCQAVYTRYADDITISADSGTPRSYILIGPFLG